jgi:[FeFe] hydrogenase H-cluster maturation GTPase HydF
MIERDHVGIFGKMNSGKSSLMNLLTQQETSLVDPTPGTTADTRTALMELHGLGPVKLFDTAGIDEAGALGHKKRRKAGADLKACDLVLLVVDPATGDFAPERELVGRAREHGKQLLVLYNLFRPEDRERIAAVEEAIPDLRFHRGHSLVAVAAEERAGLIDFLLAHYDSPRVERELIPFCERDATFVLNIPMDVETPGQRLLRPQAMAVEYLLRNWARPVLHRMDLAAGRAADPAVREAERRRWQDLLDGPGRPPRCVITDSQAIDLVAPWTPAAIPVTTFSIVMIEYVSAGRLALFVEGIRALRDLGPGDRVLVVEACNHSRVGEDIGTVQIPRILAARFPGVKVEHNFGREFLDNEQLAEYRLIIHCGGCMISPQKLQARVRDLAGVGVPLTNYGVFLAWARGLETLRRVLVPWGLDRLI